MAEFETVTIPFLRGQVPNPVVLFLSEEEANSVLDLVASAIKDRFDLPAYQKHLQAIYDRLLALYAATYPPKKEILHATTP